MELPRYRCHKIVQAAKITRIDPEPEWSRGSGNWPMHLDGHRFPIPVHTSWIVKHKPVVGGYYVVYEDGYASYSPADAFEAGYTLIGPSFMEAELAERFRKDFVEFANAKPAESEGGTPD